MRVSNWRQTGAWVAGTYAVYLVYLLTSEYRLLYGDAGTYWELAYRFFRGHAFSLLNYNDSMRGYFYPLLNVPGVVVQALLTVSAATAAKLLGAGYAALSFGVVGPRLWQAVSGASARSAGWRTAAFGVLGFVFWRGYFNFPMSDFPALLALALALLALWRHPGLWGSLLAGAALAAALNIRPIYLAAAPFVAALVLWGPQPAAGRRVPAGLGFLLGLMLILAPQALLNYRHFHRATPLVLAESPKYGTKNLYLEKLIWGLQHQKYETRIEPNEAVSALLFLDPAGLALTRQEHLTAGSSYAAYTRALLHHPADFAGLYARHLFNGLDLQYSTPFVRHPERSTLGFALLNYSVWFLVLVLLFRLRWQLSRAQWLTLGAWLAPVAVVLPMSMECRFVLPLHLLGYAVLAFGWPKHWRPRQLSWRTGLRLAAAYAGFVLLCLALSGAAQASLEAGPRLLQ